MGHTRIEKPTLKITMDNILGAHYLPTHNLITLEFQETNDGISFDSDLILIQ